VPSFYGGPCAADHGAVNRDRDFVFGYGSLVTGHERGHVARLHGHTRVWGVAMDNRKDIPGYKCYRLRADGSRPAVFVAFVDIQCDPADAVTGVCMPVSAAQLRALDERERNYDRVDVTDAVEGCAKGRVFAYRGSQAGRARLREGVEQGQAVVSSDYLAGVAAGIGAIARAEAEAVQARLAGLRVLDLERVELA
jgi:hypothetical protein